MAFAAVPYSIGDTSTTARGVWGGGRRDLLVVTVARRVLTFEIAARLVLKDNGPICRLDPKCSQTTFAGRLLELQLT